MTTLLIATCPQWPTLPESLQPLVSRLKQYDVEVKVMPWQLSAKAYGVVQEAIEASFATIQANTSTVISDESTVELVSVVASDQDLNVAKADFILPLAAWDYAQMPLAFEAWLLAAKKQGAKFINPPELMQWNMRKTYLCDLATEDVPVIPTAFVEEVTEQNIRQCVRDHQWSKVVLKPVIGQSGHAVVRWNVDEEVMPAVSDYPEGVIVQPYMEAIETYGETCMVFFNGKFSHAIKRQPPKGEWRANSAYGAQILQVMMSSQAMKAAQQTLAVLPKKPLYVRIDGTDIMNEGRFVINEVELIEPALYCHMGDEASEMFFITLMKKMGLEVE